MSHILNNIEAGGGGVVWLVGFMLHAFLPANRLLVQADGGQNGLHHAVRIAVGARATVLKVAETVVGDAARNANGAPPIGDARTEIGDVAGLMVAGQAARIVGALLRIVGGNVARMHLGQFLDRHLDVLQTAGAARRLRRDIGVRTGAVPVADHRLRVQRGNDL